MVKLVPDLSNRHFGHDLEIVGDNKVIVGYRNNVKGSNNIIIGWKNSVQGSNHVVVGVYDKIEGTVNNCVGFFQQIIGRENKIFGMNPDVDGEKNVGKFTINVENSFGKLMVIFCVVVLVFPFLLKLMVWILFLYGTYIIVYKKRMKKEKDKGNSDGNLPDEIINEKKIE